MAQRVLWDHRVVQVQMAKMELQVVRVLLENLVREGQTACLAESGSLGL